MVTIQDSIKSIVSDYRAALLLAGGATRRYDQAKIARPAPGSTGTEGPRDFGNEADEIEALMERVAKVVHIRFTDFGSRRKVERQAILQECGHPSIEVGYLYGWTERGVEKARDDAGLDRHTGGPRNQITAPSRDAWHKAEMSE